MMIKKITVLSIALLVTMSGNIVAGEKTNIFEPLTAEQRRTAEEADTKDREFKRHAASENARNSDGANANDFEDFLPRVKKDQPQYININIDKFNKFEPKNHPVNFKEKASEAVEDGVIGGISHSIASIISNIITLGFNSAWNGTKYVAKKIWQSEQDRKNAELQKRFVDLARRGVDLDNKIELAKYELELSAKEQENAELQKKLERLRAKKLAEQLTRQSELTRKPEETIQAEMRKKAEQPAQAAAAA